MCSGIASHSNLGVQRQGSSGLRHPGGSSCMPALCISDDNPTPSKNIILCESHDPSGLRLGPTAHDAIANDNA
jgi:hypothetical protein